MGQEIASSLEIIVLIVVLIISDRYSGLLGAVIYAAIALTVKIPGIGKLFRNILNAPIYLMAIIRPLAWLISSSGVLLGLGIHYIIWGSPNRNIEFWVILIIAFWAVLKIVYKILTFDVPYFDDFYIEMKTKPHSVIQDVVGEIKHHADENIYLRLARSSFVDQTLPQFFQLLISIGIIYLCLGNLKILSFSSSAPPNLWESILLAFSLMKITGESNTPFYGNLWDILQLISSVIAFLWLVLFISLSSTSVDKAAVDVGEDILQDLQFDMKKFVSEELDLLKTKNAASTKNLLQNEINYKTISQAKAIKIYEAHVDPPSVDAGNESVTLINLAAKSIILDGWKLEDKYEKIYEIPSITIQARSYVSIGLPAYSIQLSNTDGSIRLINETGAEVDYVTYKRSHIDHNGNVNWWK